MADGDAVERHGPGWRSLATRSTRRWLQRQLGRVRRIRRVDRRADGDAHIDADRPTIGAYEKTRYDVSKLRQWETVFTHAQRKGIHLHFQLAETESGNENYHDGGSLGVERKLYYRELIARFGHHNAVQFNLGEENDYGTTKRERFAAHLKALDPYDHPVTTHTHGNSDDGFYDPLLGNGDFDVAGFQGGWSGDGYLLEKPGDVYAIYLPDGDAVDVDLASGTYDLRWFNPRTGNFRDLAEISDGSSTDLPSPPFGGDAAAIIERRS